MYLNNISIQIGKKYIIKPDNIKKMKNRDRKCLIVELEDHLTPSWAKVKFLDTNRTSKINDLSDLKEINND